MTKPLFQAHRGLSTLFPENTLVAFQAAIDEGYQIIELDPKMTRDDQCVILHDETINRTARDSKGRKFLGESFVSLMESDELKKLDFGTWKDEKFSGIKLPFLEDVLDLMQRHKVVFKFDNCYEKFTERQTAQFFYLLNQTRDTKKIALTCSTVESVKRAVAYFPEIEIHYDGFINEPILKEVKTIVNKQALTFWIAYPNEHTKWCELPKASEQLCQKIKEYGNLGIWTIGSLEEYMIATTVFKADAIETDGEVTPHNSHL